MSKFPWREADYYLVAFNDDQRVVSGPVKVGGTMDVIGFSGTVKVVAYHDGKRVLAGHIPNGMGMPVMNGDSVTINPPTTKTQVIVHLRDLFGFDGVWGNA